MSDYILEDFNEHRSRVEGELAPNKELESVFERNLCARVILAVLRTSE